MIGRNLGPYQLIERLARAAPYATFRAIDTRTFNQPVAVTVFDLQHGTPAAPEAGAPAGPTALEAARRFEHLAEELTALRHPNIVPLLDFGEGDGLAYVASPLLESATVADHLGRPRRPEEVLPLVATLCTALDHAARDGLAHGGITPETVRLINQPLDRPWGQETLHGAWPLLSDFGFVTLAKPPPSEPEAEGAEVLAAQRATDLRALATVTLALLAGVSSKPQDEETGEPPAPASLPPGLGAVLRRALAPAPAPRFGSGAEFVAALSEAIVADRRGFHEIATALLEEARTAVTEGRFRAAEHGYDAYLRLRPDDELARRELATLESRRVESLRRRATPEATPAEPSPPANKGPVTPVAAAAEAAPGADPTRPIPRWRSLLGRGRLAPADGARPPHSAAPAPPRTAGTGVVPAKDPAATPAVPPRPSVAAPGVGGIRNARPGVPLRPLVAPARERQRLVLPTALGMLALLALLVSAGTLLARRNGEATGSGTPARSVVSGTAPALGTIPLPVGAAPTQTRAANIIPPTIPIAPTFTPPTPTLAPTVPPLEPVRVDEFFDATSGFPPQIEGREGTGYQNGEYVIIVPEPDGLAIADLTYPGSEFGDLVVEVDIRAVGPTAGGSYGLAFHREIREGSINQYFVLIDPDDGTVRLVKFLGTERTEVVPKTPHPAIARGEETNRLIVTVKGVQITIQINGVQVAQINDAGPQRGLLALRADAGAGPMEAHFDNLVIRPAR